MGSKKMREVVIISSFLCCLVIMIHISSYPVNGLEVGSFAHALFFLANKVLSFVVPGFLFLSGLKLMYGYGKKPFSYGVFLRKRFLKILIPYVVWYVAYYGLFRILGYVEQKTLTGHLHSFLLGDLVSPFYFVTIIVQFYLLFGVIRWLFQKLPHGIILVVVIMIQLFCLERIRVPYEDRFFLSYLIYFVWGCYVAFHLEEVRNFLRKTLWIWTVAFLVLTTWHIFHAYGSAVMGTPYGHWKTITCLFSMSGILCCHGYGILLAEKLPEKPFSVLAKIDAISYTVFLSHCFFLYLLNEIWARAGIASLSFQFIGNTILLYPIVFLFSTMVIFGEKQLFGRMRQKK